MPNKATIASDWLAGCAGCHMSLLDMDERLLAVLGRADLLATPITDLKQPPVQGVDVGILEGAVNNSSHVEVAHRMRARCRCLVAMGDCAVFGGVPTLGNAVDRDAALRRAYVETESTVDGQVPAHEDLAKIQSARALDEVVQVDVYLPGCPPSANAIAYVITELLDGRKPRLEGALLDWH